MKKRILEDVSLMMLGAVLFGTALVGAQELLSSNEIIYDNAISVSNSDTVQGAIDDLYDRTSALAPLYKNIVIVDNTIYYGTEEIGKHPIYFDVTTGEKCNINDYEGNQDKMGKSGCMKFYAYSENSDGVNMILDHSTTESGIAWASKEDYQAAESKITDLGITYLNNQIPNDNYDIKKNDNGNSAGSNNRGPLTVLEQLKKDTKDWNLDERTDSYTATTSNGVGEASGYKINYSTYKAKLISAEEVNSIARNADWTPSKVWYYLDSFNQTNHPTTKGASAYAWLYDNLTNCENSGCSQNTNTDSAYGYWTSTARDGDSSITWAVHADGTLGHTYVSNTYRGVRPVITVSKDKLQ